ncbi:sigma-70 family RNA polymerase sigma factor [Sporosarcina oncorhynchi]|uniref:Sigma-70 family RNA polymerase sigma factor n=1 Tax=Sporosarcina oncorhynchi TaxID=3056444 RepID=A0ABZ0L3W1_9BACL|nr:sigma-70 family RNA polymerase sigma factor [Sporosarcina sp. T2O-4]WOV86855.1 sigma-70 family RNA polymerase sigma factor [Sporosarcina sp. T2O-4]
MQDVLKKAQKGNEQAFLHLFQPYEEDIYRMAFMYVKNPNDALDIVQETAYRSFKHIKSVKEASYFKTWLLRIAINCSLDLLRANQKTLQLYPETEENIPETIQEDIDLKVTLNDLMNGLNENEKSVVILKFYNGLTFKEIGETLDMPLGTAKTILYRALENLRAEWKGDDRYEQ